MEALSAYSLPPGFGFHPTDAELVSHYLKRKILGLKFDYEIIPEIDIYKHEPWDLPARCCVPTRDAKWHFFASHDKKYPNGSRSNRATEAGYWKSTGKDRNIKYQNRLIGTKKTLVFHEGRPPRGKRTEWIMHEYYVNGNEFKDTPDLMDSYVLCRVTNRNGWELDSDNVCRNVTPPSVNICETSKQSEDVASSVAQEKSSSPSESVEDIDAWLEELYDPNFSGSPIRSEVQSEQTEGHSSVAVNHEPINSHFHHDVLEDSHLLFQVDEFPNPKLPRFDFAVNQEPINSHFHHDVLEDSHLLFQVDEFPNPELPRFDFAVNQEPITSHFHHDVLEDSHLLFQVDEFLNPEPPSFDFCGELNIQNFNSFCDQQEDVDVSAHLNSDIDEFTTNSDSTTWTGIQRREREAKPSSTTTLSSRIKFQVSKMESRNCETLCQIFEVSEGVHLGRINSLRSDNNKIVSTKALRARKGSSFGPLAFMSCFFCMMGMVALICYFSRDARSFGGSSKALEL